MMTNTEKKTLKNLFIELSSGYSLFLTGGSSQQRTALLNHLSDFAIQKNFLPEPEQFLWVYVDCAKLPVTSSPSAFWNAALRPTLEHKNFPKSLRSPLKLLIDGPSIDIFDFETYFIRMSNEHLTQILLLDNWELFFKWPKETITSVLSCLRFVSSSASGLRVVFSSSKDIATLNKETAFLNPFGSPYFNTYFEIKL